MHTQFLLFSNTLLCPRNFCELVILCVMLLCPNNLVHCYRNVRETQWIPNKPKARRLWPTYRLTSVSVNTPSNSSPTQSQTKIVGTLRPNAVFFLLVLPLSLSKLFITVQSPNLVYQHWTDKETQKCPNNFDWDCSYSLPECPAWMAGGKTDFLCILMFSRVIDTKTKLPWENYIMLI